VEKCYHNTDFQGVLHRTSAVARVRSIYTKIVTLSTPIILCSPLKGRDLAMHSGGVKMHGQLFYEFQLARYAKRCQCINRTLCKYFTIFEISFDLPSQLLIYNSLLRDRPISKPIGYFMRSLASRLGKVVILKLLMQSNALIMTVGAYLLFSKSQTVTW